MGKRTRPVGMLDEASIIEDVKGILRAKAPGSVGLDKLGLEDDLFDEGILDSVATIMLVVEIQKKFGIRIDARDFVPANFSTMRSLARLVLKSPPNS